MHQIQVKISIVECIKCVASLKTVGLTFEIKEIKMAMHISRSIAILVLFCKYDPLLYYF